jgi:NCAIR mutase (PurE)-related protein
MELNYSSEAPKKVILMGARRKVNYNIRELSDSELNELWDKVDNNDMPYDYFVKEHKYAYNSVVIGSARFTYEGVVEAIIRDKYSVDQMEAITNNMAAINAVFMQTLVSGGIVEAIKFLKESAKSNDAEGFRLMQEWRALAKKEAKEVFNM